MSNLGMNQSAFMDALVKEIKIQQNEAIEKMLGDAIQKGIITVRQSDPILIQDPMSSFPKLRHSLVIDYLGAEKIEQLQQDVETLKKINGDLHTALSDFYEKTKVNQWLKNK